MPEKLRRPRTIRAIRHLVLRLARENPVLGLPGASTANCSSWGSRSPPPPWEILRQAEIDPAPERTSTTWADFLRSQADALLACDFFETVTLTSARLYVLAVIEHATRQDRILGATPHPAASWVAQAARNPVVDLQDAGARARFFDPGSRRQVPRPV